MRRYTVQRPDELNQIRNGGWGNPPYLALVFILLQYLIHIVNHEAQFLIRQ